MGHLGQGHAVLGENFKKIKDWFKTGEGMKNHHLMVD